MTALDMVVLESSLWYGADVSAIYIFPPFLFEILFSELTNPEIVPLVPAQNNRSS